MRHAVLRTIADSKNGYDLNEGDPSDDEMDIDEKEKFIQDKIREKAERLLKRDKFTKRRDREVSGSI